MSLPVIWAKSGASSGNHFQTQTYGRHVLLDLPSLTALGVPNDGTQKFATLAYIINAGDINGSTNSTPTTPTTTLVNVISAGTPVKAANSGTYSSLFIIAKKGLNTVNTGIVKIGFSGNLAINTQPLPLNPGDTYALSPPQGQIYNLSDLIIDAVTSGDGIVIIYS